MLLTLIIGIIVGRSLDAIYHKTYSDIHRVTQKIKTTKTAFTLYYVLERIYSILERRFSKQELVSCSHDLISSCDKRGCKPIKIETYWRKMKATN